MKITLGLLLSVLASAVCAGAEDAGVYIFQKGEWPSSAKPPVLSPEQARLIIAQRLDVTQYHSIEDASWIQDINKFGSLHTTGQSKVREVVLVVEGVTMSTALPLAKPFMSLEAAFKIRSPPSSSWTQKLVEDFQTQVGATTVNCAIEEYIDPSTSKCQTVESMIWKLDLAAKSPSVQELRKLKDFLIEQANNGEINLMVIFMPESARSAQSSSDPYGIYSMPSQVHLQIRELAEEPMTEPAALSPSSTTSQSEPEGTSNSSKPITGVPAVCYTSIDSCNNATNSCSGHGKCYRKSGTEKNGCFACLCAPTQRNFTVGESKKEAFTLDYWGGAACQKEDVSGPFWLLATFSLVLVGLVAWAISMLFAIGEEKLPGVIGAGVSNKAR